MVKYTLRGYVRLVRLSAAKMWQALYLLVYSLVLGVVSLVRYLWQTLVWFVAGFPRIFIGIVCVLFVLNFMLMRVSYRMTVEEQNMRFDSLSALTDSIQRYSTYDSGYARGVRDACIQIDNNDGLKEEESIIH